MFAEFRGGAPVRPPPPSKYALDCRLVSRTRRRQLIYSDARGPAYVHAFLRPMVLTSAVAEGTGSYIDSSVGS